MPSMNPNRSVLAAVAVVSAAVVLSGCSSEPPALTFGAAKPSGARLSAQPPRGASVPLAQWPNACEVLGDEEVRAILPQAKDFQREPVKVTVLNFNPMAKSDPGTTGDVPAGGCKTEFSLPAKYKGKHNSYIRIVFKAVADPALVDAAYTEDRDDEAKRAAGDTKKFRDLGNSLGAAGCYTKSLTTTMICHQGPYQFEVGGMSTADGVGKYPDSDENWRAKVLTEVVRTLSARMA
ncbi:hypothetical protein OHS33_02480 [Streptomyces sp. NBC_00536]|uniref:hypothetical protein n=1 Tax=Streptomyces sp. NBC_00536 TaxID=2975769 RepID=UPI002E81E597|nr:hypothetical protein [Streptomyces sp. NBC_00536]WUC77318.1 hypothetical protein OHS33_02480 [Streptomyces sp. NBC_00536]